MDWDYSMENYPQIYVRENHVAGLSMWLEKILDETIERYGEWNVLIAELWPYGTGTRVIGFVQMKDDPIGCDIGFRVCAYLENCGIVGNTTRDVTMAEELLSKAAAALKTKKIISELNKENPFDIKVTMMGRNHDTANLSDNRNNESDIMEDSAVRTANIYEGEKPIVNTIDLAERSGLSVVQVEIVLEALSDQVRSTLRNYDTYNLMDLIILKTNWQPGLASKKGVNPVTGDEVVFPAKNASAQIRTLPTQELTRALNLPGVTMPGSSVDIDHGLDSHNHKNESDAEDYELKFDRIYDGVRPSMNLDEIAECSGLLVTQVESVLVALSDQVKVAVRNYDTCNLMDLVIIKTIHKPGAPSRMGVNPFTGEDVEIRAKNASVSIQIKRSQELAQALDLRGRRGTHNKPH